VKGGGGKFDREENENREKGLSGLLKKMNRENLEKGPGGRVPTIEKHPGDGNFEKGRRSGKWPRAGPKSTTIPNLLERSSKKGP